MKIILKIITLTIILSSIVSCYTRKLTPYQSFEMKNTTWCGLLSDGDTITISLDEHMQAQVTYRGERYVGLWATLGSQDASLEGFSVGCEHKYVWDINQDGNMGKKWVEKIMLNEIIYTNDKMSILNWKYDNNKIEKRDTLILKNN